MEDQSGEMLEIVDEHNRVVGETSRGEMHRKNLMHRSAHIFLFDAHGRIFLQKRSKTKDRFPLRYDSSAAGHLKVGESYADCARRELEEELGVRESPLMEVAHFKACQDTGWEHVSLFICHTEEPVNIDLDEIAEGRYLRLEEVAERIEENPSAFTPDFMLILKWFEHNKDSFEGLIREEY